jgi:hypothetical protein
MLTDNSIFFAKQSKVWARFVSKPPRKLVKFANQLFWVASNKSLPLSLARSLSPQAAILVRRVIFSSGRFFSLTRSQDEFFHQHWRARIFYWVTLFILLASTCRLLQQSQASGRSGGIDRGFCNPHRATLANQLALLYYVLYENWTPRARDRGEKKVE